MPDMMERWTCLKHSPERYIDASFLYIYLHSDDNNDNNGDDDDSDNNGDDDDDDGDDDDNDDDYDVGDDS